MTQPYQPQYQPQPPTGYGFGQPGQYPVGPPNPQVRPTPQQQYYGQPAQQTAGPVGGQAMPTQAPALGQSTRTGGDGPKAPAPRHLVGRTVIFEPIRIDETTTQKNDKTGEMEVRPTAYYHLTIVDGGPLQYGDNQSRNPKEAHGLTMEVATPARFLNVSSDRFGIVNEVRDAMARGDMASVGVVQQGTRGNFPFLVTKTGRDLDGNDRPDGAERFERATLVWNDIFAKRFVSPEPRSLVAAPSSTPPQVQYQPQPAAPVQQPTPPPYGDNPAGYFQANAYAAQQQAATQPAYGYPTPPSAGPGYGQNPMGQEPSYVATPTPQSAPPVNLAFEAYIASLPPEQQAAARAQFAPQPQQPTQPAGPGF